MSQKQHLLNFLSRYPTGSGKQFMQYMAVIRSIHQL